MHPAKSVKFDRKSGEKTPRNSSLFTSHYIWFLYTVVTRTLNFYPRSTVCFVLVSALSVQRDLGPRSWSKGWGKHLDLVIAESWAQPWWLSYNSYKIKMDQDGSRWIKMVPMKRSKNIPPIWNNEAVGMDHKNWGGGPVAWSSKHGPLHPASMHHRHWQGGSSRTNTSKLQRYDMFNIFLTYFWHIYDHSMKSGYVQCAFHAFRSESMTTHPIRRGAACCPLAECTTTWRYSGVFITCCKLWLYVSGLQNTTYLIEDPFNPCQRVSSSKEATDEIQLSFWPQC